MATVTPFLRPQPALENLPAFPVLLVVAGDPVRKRSLTQVFQIPHYGSSIHQELDRTLQNSSSLWLFFIFIFKEKK